MWVRIGVVVPFRVLIIELDRELIVFKNSLLVESFSGPRPQDIINKIVKIAKLIKPKIRNIFMMKKKIYNMFSKIRKI
jgi:hypothetical protein